MKTMAEQTPPPPHGNFPRFFHFFTPSLLKTHFKYSQESNNSGFSDSTVLGSFNALSTFTSFAGVIVEVDLEGQTTNLTNQTYQTKPAKPNLPNQIKPSLPSVLKQTYQTKITGQSSQRLGP